MGWGRSPSYVGRRSARHGFGRSVSASERHDRIERRTIAFCCVHVERRRVRSRRVVVADRQTPPFTGGQDRTIVMESFTLRIGQTALDMTRPGQFRIDTAHHDPCRRDRAERFQAWCPQFVLECRLGHECHTASQQEFDYVKKYGVGMSLDAVPIRHRECERVHDPFLDPVAAHTRATDCSRHRVCQRRFAGTRPPGNHRQRGKRLILHAKSFGVCRADDAMPLNGRVGADASAGLSRPGHRDRSAAAAGYAAAATQQEDNKFDPVGDHFHHTMPRALIRHASVSSRRGIGPLKTY